MIPFWNSRGSYVIFKETKDSETPVEWMVLKEQSVDRVASTIGVTKNELGKPLMYYIPSGWLILVAIGLVVKFTSGPGPQKRFERIWINPAYRTAIAKLFKIENSTFPLEFETIVLEASPDPSH